MKNFSRIRVLSIFFVTAFLLAARSGILAHAATLVKGPQMVSHVSVEGAQATEKIESPRIGESASTLSADDKSGTPEMHESKEPDISSPEAASTDEDKKEAFGSVETTASFDNQESNSNGSNDSPSHDANKDNSNGSSSNGVSAHTSDSRSGNSGSGDD